MEQEDSSEIREFFKGRSVFITGASGYLGTVLLEHLLRLCPDIVEIFILLREKRGNSPEKRKEKILEEEIFWKIKRDNPKAFEKISTVPGDVAADNLGISSDDLQKLKENVSVVFHCAASVSFSRNFRFMAVNNVLGTQNVVDVCKTLPKIAALVHTSTAYSNCYQKVIEEEIARMPFSVKNLVEAARANDAEFLDNIGKEYGEKWPNAYTFSKSIAENIVIDEAAGIPRAIIRPSIINVVWKGSLPGYLQTTKMSFVELIVAIALGYLQVLLADETKKIDTIPPDIVSNTMISSAWSVATKRTRSPLVINCVSSKTVPYRLNEILEQLMERRYYALSPYSIRFGNVTITRSTAWYKLLSFLYHHVPSYALDTYAVLTGRKARAVKACQKLDQSMLDARFFVLHDFNFKTTHFEELRSLLSKRDKEDFCMDLSGYSLVYMVKATNVHRIFRFKNDDVALRYKQVAFATKIEMYTQFYKGFLLLLLALLIWNIMMLFTKILM